MPATRVDVALALLGAPEAGIDGLELARHLEVAGRRSRPSALLAHLLSLEDGGYVHVDRGDQYRFSLTRSGEALAYELGPGSPTVCVLVMVDLVGFVAYTAEHGDAAAHEVANELRLLGEGELGRVDGKLVKFLGDGFLASVRPTIDAVALVRRIAEGCGHLDGKPWSLRAAVHRGAPIHHRGDLFGADVNLVARLCDVAVPDELVLSLRAATPEAEMVTVRGLNTPTPIERVRLR